MLCRGVGYNIKIYKPATLEQIEQWECENGIKLPESYCHLLRFADGFYFKKCSENIFGLNRKQLKKQNRHRLISCTLK